jgi:uncharacterized protein
MHVKALLPWALGGKVVLAIVLLVASQYHLWSRLSSGSVFSPEFPRALVFLFNWAFGAIVLLALMQIALDVTALVARLVRPGWATPDGLCYAAAITAMLLSALGVYQATRVPPLKDVEIAIPGRPAGRLPPRGAKLVHDAALASLGSQHPSRRRLWLTRRAG